MKQASTARDVFLPGGFGGRVSDIAEGCCIAAVCIERFVIEKGKTRGGSTVPHGQN